MHDDLKLGFWKQPVYVYGGWSLHNDGIADIHIIH
jgi:hypothetical protein